ncbi:MAG: hypothetical protein RL641_709 [Candidatus Parcubacteria bacterium]|jgi:uncharacterized protein YjaZ
MSVDLYILKKGDRLLPYESIIRAAFDEVILKIKEKIDLPDVDVIVVDNPLFAIPETGVSGFVNSKHLVTISINPDLPQLEETLAFEICSTIAHELNHCIRMKAVSSYGNLLEALVSEGLADNFDIEINGSKLRPWSVSLDDEKLAELKKSAEADIKNNKYNHDDWFFGREDRGIPRWAGYSIGFDIVKKYIQKSGKKASELTTTKAEEFFKITD